MERVDNGSRDEYWNKDRTIEIPVFAQAMIIFPLTKKAFMIKIGFLPKFQRVYKPQRELSLDESILIQMVNKAKTGNICNSRIYHGEGSHLQEII